GGLTFIGQDPAVIARWMGASLFALNIVLVALSLCAALPQSYWILLIGSWFMLTSVDMLAIHTMAWSEPSFLFFSLLGLFVLAVYLEKPRGWQLLLAAGLCAVSWFVRYIGGALLVTGVIAILLWDRRTWSLRLRAALLFSILTLAPIVLWQIRYPTDRSLA